MYDLASQSDDASFPWLKKLDLFLRFLGLVSRKVGGSPKKYFRVGVPWGGYPTFTNL